MNSAALLLLPALCTWSGAPLLAATPAPQAPAPGAPMAAPDRTVFDPAAEASGAGWAQLAREHGATVLLRAHYFHSSRRLDDASGFPGVTAQLKTLPRLNARLDGKLELRLTQADLGRHRGLDGEVLEAYFTLRFDRADLRLGKQIVAWGRADGINPTDNLTPRDFAVMLPFEEDQRSGTPAARLDVYLTHAHTLTLYATPFFEPSEVALPADAQLVQRRPPRSLSEGAVGVKLDKVGGRLDWSVSFYRGRYLLPNTRVPASSAPAFELHHPHIRAFGADFARNFGRFGVRGELAYIDTPDEAGTDPEVLNPHLFWIVGVDRTFFSNLNVNLQFIQRRVRHFRDPARFADPLERAVALQNALVAGQLDPIGNALSFRVSHRWRNDTVEAEIFASYSLTRADGFIRPLITYAFTDRLKGTLGGEYFRGRADTPFGLLARNRGGFAELRYAF